MTCKMVIRVERKYVLDNPCCLDLVAALSAGCVSILAHEMGKSEPCISSRKNDAGGWFPFKHCPWCGSELGDLA